tara:strand:- start:9377 stop:10180 length:804 start_codon:yes stop_codon:yes gene_type:complete
MTKVVKNLVYVKPIIKERWHGLHKIGRAKFQGTSDVLQAVYDRNLGVLATGLDEEQRERLSKSMGVDLAPIQSNEYWHEFKVKLEDKTMIFDTNIPFQELQISMLRASSQIANSQKEHDNGMWPDAKYVIYDEQQEVEKEAKTAEVKANAFSIFSKLSPSKRLDVLKIFGKATTNSSEDFTYARLYEILEEDPKRFSEVASAKPEEIKVKALMFDLEGKGILRTKGAAYLYNDQQLGFDYDDTVMYLMNPKNQALLIKLTDDLKARE